jgi:ATP/ADP translocase/HEAT repeat protein
MLAFVAEVRPGERRGAVAAFLTLFGILASHTLLETARDALFLARLPPSQLPWVYLAMAVIAIAISQGPWRVPKQLSGRRSLSVLLVVCAAVTFLFWMAGGSTHPWALRALYVWSGILGTLSALQFWMVLGELYTVTQAKRLYKIVGAGALLGAVAGAGLARIVAAQFGSAPLVLASAIVLALTGIGPAMMVRRPAVAVARDERGGPNLVESIRMVSGHPYVKMLGGLMLVSTVALTLADYVFKSTVVERVPAAELGMFFAKFYMILNLLALAAQALLMGWLMRVLGLHRTLWVLPGFVFLGSAGVALGGGLIAALLLKGADGTLRYSLHRTGTELLFVPLPDGLRARAKPIIDVVGQRGGQAVASLLILAEVSQHRGNTVLAAAAAALCILWVAWASELRRHYLDLFRAALREGSMRARATVHPFDLGSLEAVFAGLNSRNDAEVVGAMDILVHEGRVRLIPALILFHPSREVVLRALEHLAQSGRSDFVPVADRLLDHADEEIRAAAVRARTAGERDQVILRAAAKDRSPLVQATAIVGLVAAGWVTDEAQETVDSLLASPSPEARRALARALREQPVPVFDDLLVQLANEGDDAVQADVAQALGARRDPKFLPVLLPMIASRNVRPAARAALVAFGHDGLGFLRDALADEALPHEVRRHVPRSISRFPATDAIPVLAGRLLDEPDGMVRYKILRGLGRLAAENRDVPVDPAVVEEATRSTVNAAFRLVDWRLTLARGASDDASRATPGHELLATLLRDKEVHAIERVFRLLGLRHRGEDFEKIYRGLRSGSAKVRAGSRELLENLLEPPLREAILALVDEVPDAARLAQAAPFYVPETLAYEPLLFKLLDQEGETVRCIAAYHVGELGLTAFRERLLSFQQVPTGLFVQRVIERALALLAPGDRLQYAR